MAHHRCEEADFSEDCSDGETLDSSEEDEYDTPLKTAHDRWRISFVMKMNPLSHLRPRNNISGDDDIIVTFLFSFLQQCVKLEHLNLKWE